MGSRLRDWGDSFSYGWDDPATFLSGGFWGQVFTSLWLGPPWRGLFEFDAGSLPASYESFRVADGGGTDFYVDNGTGGSEIFGVLR